MLKNLSGHVPTAAVRQADSGRWPATNQLSLAIGLPPRDAAALDEFVRELYDPASPHFHQFITPQEFAARFGPSEADYATVKNFAQTNGFTVTGTHDNRLVLDVRADAARIERALHINLRKFQHPTEAREFFAPDVDPTVDAAIPVEHIAGLDNFSLPRPMSVVRPLTGTAAKIAPHAGSGSGGSYVGNDFRASYAPGSALTGSGQSVALLQFDGYYASDIAAYINLAGLTNYPVALTNIAVNGGVVTPGSGNVEVCLDIEMVLSMSPGVSKILVYEAPNGGTAWSTILSRIANDNLAKQIGCSWGSTSPGAKDPTSETIFKQMAAQGQSFFNASGDADAFTNGIPFPSESTNITQVGGTILSTTGPGGDWTGESSWNRNNGIGTSGGVSANYSIPIWQQGLSMTSNHGSTTLRNVPDVAMTGESVLVLYNHGATGVAGGTSCAAPLWAGFMALVNQQAVAAGQAPVGFINPAVYAIGNSSLYSSCFHDTIVGNNFRSTSPTNFPAVAGFDLCTGWGTPTGTNLMNALIYPPPIFSAQPLGRTVTNGASVVFSTTVGSAGPVSYAWLLNGTNLADGGNFSGSASNVLTITSATSDNGGSYQLVASSANGTVISGVAVLNVGFAPVVSQPPTNQTVLSGGNSAFAAAVDGSSPLFFQWRKSGTNLANGTGISGAASNVLSLTGVTTNRNGSYSLYATNLFGAVTSSVAVLTVVLPPTIASSAFTNRAVECGRNTNKFTLTAAGTPPLTIQWSLDGLPVAGATGSNFALTNLNLASHTVSAVVTNLYGSVTSNALLTVHDTLAPAITLTGSNPLYVELGASFADPGATANDACAGPVAALANGTIDTSAVGTNTLTYLATDGNGNTSSATRTVLVRDSTPPVILWSFTNLILVADANCSAPMPLVTGTNFFLATDLSGALTYAQKPTNHSVLLLGTNVVVITVKDASGNAANSTNSLVVVDQTPPVITLNGGNPAFAELGAAYIDAGAIANDTCAGVVPVVTSGSVNANLVGTNELSYTADDGNGNTNAASRSVMVRDTTPPVIGWSFTNLTLAAETNCTATLPDVTGTNFILATDFSGPLTVTQTPTNGSVLLPGTNLVVLAVADVYGNTSFSTNAIVVQEQTPPMIAMEPQSLTNVAGTSAHFSVAVTACTPLSFQWFFGNAAVAAGTNISLTLSNLSAAAAGNYFVVVVSAGGARTSDVASLTVNLLAPSLTVNSSINPLGFNSSSDFLSAGAVGFNTGLYFIATLSPVDASGTVRFFTNGDGFDITSIVAGQAASTNLALLPRGTNFITATYSGDAFYSPATNTFAQIVTNHPPAATLISFNRFADLPLSLSVADLATHWTDVDGDALALADFSVSTNGVALTNQAGTLVYFNASNVADQFICTIRDDWGGTNFQIINLAVVLPAITGVTVNPDASFAMTFSGVPGDTCILETTPDLFSAANWQPVATNTLGTNGLWQFDARQTTNSPQQFYRLKLAP